MRKISLILFALLSLCSIHAQTNWCGTDRVLQDLKSKNPGFVEHLHKSMKKAASGASYGQKATLYIPVVVHIIHDNGIGNISDEQVQDALRVLNMDYNRQNADAGMTRNTTDAPFVAIAGDMDVEFKLAKKDPQGNCTNGIVRINAPELTYNANDDCKYASNGGSDQWPMDKYLNIWVVNSIENDGPGMILGYAYLPYWPNGENYGILIRHDSFGTIGTSTSDGRTMTHEMGHLLGLQHIFDAGWNGDTGCHDTDCNGAGDYCCDTPPQTEANWSCSMTWNSCNLIPQNDDFGFDAFDQIENYMSYNACQNMFSMDQVGIMQQNFVDIDFLANMVTPANIIATGINDPEVLCKSEFDALKKTVCTGESVQFLDYSFHGPTSWSWSITPGTAGVDWAFAGGTDATSANPQIVFNTQGYYSISLLVSDGTDSDTEIKSNFISVLPSSQILPYWEGFESYSALASTQNWIVVNTAENAEFEVTGSAAHSGVKSVKLNNYGQGGTNKDELISAPIDLSGVDPLTDNVTLSFRYAYRKRNASNDEWLKVFISANCGDSWVQRKTIHGDQLSPLVVGSSWTPQAQADWTTVHMTNITANYFSENFRMKFRFEGENGNNFYLDDINLYKGSPSDVVILGLAEAGEIEELSIYPNPTEEFLNLRFSIGTDEHAKIMIKDVSGKLLKQNEIFAQLGSNLVMMDVTDLSSGMYFIQLQIGAAERTLQFVKK
jgi:PKD repeat protein